MSIVLVNSNFDAGNIVINDITDSNNLRFGIRQDSESEFAQWFYFQLNEVKNKNLTIRLEDLDKSAYPEGWDWYNVCASYDNKNWFRIPSKFNNNTNELKWSVTPEHNSIYFAYFEPYSYHKHQELIGLANSSDLCEHEIIGYTYNNHAIDLLRIGNTESEKKVWITARQHPGETMAEWFMEGVIKRLLNPHDAVARVLRDKFEFYLVPNMNPDGSILGNLRTNAQGINLNREWLNPSLEVSSEVFFVRKRMLSTGVEMFFDIHGDESIPYVFTSGCSDNKSFSAKQRFQEEKFEYVFKNINPDYQTEIGYPKNFFSLESSSVAAKWVGDKFNCLSYTLEMPFKDNANLPDPTTGWNGERSKMLGADLLTAIHQMLS